MVPEASWLALHAHEHTEDLIEKNDHDLKLDKKHTHCHTDNLFNTPFSPATLTALPTLHIPFTDTYSARTGYIWKFTFPNNTELRGPPVA